MMNDLNVNQSGFLSKAAALLNNKTFSDVEIQVIHGNNSKSYYAHKLFLSMNSEEFHKIFYASPNPPKVIKIFDFMPKVVFMMLEFLYMKKVNLTDSKEARELYTLSKDFRIRNLQELCVDYISREEVNNGNVLQIYECALRDKFLNCLNFCRDIISSDTKAILESPSFIETSCSVLEDILKQDTLTVDSELDIVKAVIEWSIHECNRQNLDHFSHLGKCILPLLPHIRFLNLKYEEFCDIVEKYPILTPHESSLVTRKLLQPDKSICLPPHLCQISKPRRYSADTGEINLKNNYPTNVASQDIELKFPLLENGKLKQCPVSKVSPLVNVSSRKTFDFSLQEAEKLMSTAFINDVKCSVSIHLLKGMIIIHGVEIRISQNKNTGESINVILTASSRGMNYSLSDTSMEELTDNTLTLMFNQPMKILQNYNAEIEVIVEDLELNRCPILKDQACKLECCSDIVADIAPRSNLNEEGKIFFLISRLIYSVI